MLLTRSDVCREILSNLEAVAAQQRAAQLESELRAAEANAVVAQQKAAQLERTSGPPGRTRRSWKYTASWARLQGNLEAAEASRRHLALELGRSQRIRFLLGDKPGGLKQFLAVA